TAMYGMTVLRVSRDPIRSASPQSLPGQPNHSRGSGAYEDDLEGAGAVHPLDLVQFDVAGGGRAADPGQGASGVQPGQGLGDQADDLVGPYQAQVVVGDQRQGATSLVRQSVEDDGARLGDRDGSAGDDAVHAVERGGGEAVVGDGLGAGRQAGHAEAGRHHDPAGAAPDQRLPNRGHELAG